MSNINLLPWREVLKARKDRSFYTNMLIVLIVATIIGACAYVGVLQMVERQKERNNYLTTEIKKLDDKISKISSLKADIQSMLQRMDTINRLQESRNQVVHLLNDLPSFVSSGIYLDKVAFKDGMVNVTGATEAHLRVVSMIRAIEASPWLKNPVIKDIVSQRNSNSVVAAAAAKFGLNLNNFDLSFSVPYSKEQTEVSAKNRGRR
jgi:type IV pilus assembly protein PilN